MPDHAAPAIERGACYDCHGDLYLAATQPDHVAAGFSRQCETCHATTAWRPAEVGDHGFWPLTGAHRLAACEGCHADGRFSGTPRDCVGCHADDFAAASNPNHVAGGFATTCETCHTTAAWRPASFDHATVWPLVGAHASVDCASCHPDGAYANTPRECVGCHRDDYQASTQPAHVALGLSTECATCHTVGAWRPADFAIHDQVWPIVGLHTAAACESCHAGGVFGGTPRACEGCHLEDYSASRNPDHAALGLPTTCAACHTAAGWEPADFGAHDQFWPIVGRHELLTCESCHVGGSYADTPRACEGCHLGAYQATTDPDHAGLELPTACGGCHTAQGWRPAGFDAHDQFWPILGKHGGVACESCHVGGAFTDTPRTCEGCHLPDYSATTAPDHAALQLATACAGCHSETGWTPAGFEAHDQYWPIEGKHVSVGCESCHLDSVFSGTARTCEGCHVEDFLATVDPPHAAAGFPKTCDTCHDVDGWTPATFDHETVWPLDGKHATATCESCHVDNHFAETPRACEGCHLSAYQQTTAPDHVALALPTACGGCHVTTGWAPAGFGSHDRFWPLLGAHAAATCASCHVDGLFAGTARACVGCHLVDYQATSDPAHAAAGYPTTCETCHAATGWAPAPFDHGRYWPLAGAHQSAPCIGCHTQGVFAGTPEVCESCHLGDYQASAHPPHAADGYPKACATCHSATAWAPTSFDHAAYWPLLGAHASTACVGCHDGGVFVGTAKTCEGCHLGDYQTTVAPPHAAAGLSTRCESCHASTAWTPAAFEHALFWPLVGAHGAATCESCHGNGVYSGTPKDCSGCHLADYQATTQPAHAAAGYPTRCEACHGAVAWKPASFDHGLFWPLDGRHATATCESCHVAGVFEGTPRSCEGCHLADYVATAGPPHAAAGFSTSCETCHSTQRWRPSTFAHDGWPLAGKHAVAACESCHVGGVYAGTPRTCGGCHEAQYQAASQPAHAAGGYPRTCEKCHGVAAWSPSTFDHAAIWPLAGRHAAATCESCHVGGVFAGTPSDCADCHLALYQATTRPAHAANGYPTSCESCHSPSGWTPAAFDHALFWPLTGRHAAATCESCHAGGVYAGTPTACAGCHLPEYAATTRPDHAASGFPATCETCHSPSDWTPATFDHALFWPLTGRHAAATCESCHAGGVYAGTPTACVGCHRPDYDASTNPAHVSLNLSTTCQTCHTTTNWSTHTFPGHDALFPITSGAHRIFSCEDCHSAPADWGVFSCTGCHTGEHRLAKVTSDHREVGNYQATVTAYGLEGACLHCHPDGRH